MAATPMQTRGGNKYLIALVAALGLIPIVLDTTIVNVALTPIRQALHSDVNTAQWVISGYFLASAAVVAIGGYLASRFGRKWLFTLGLASFTLGSALCAVAPSMNWLIAFRVFQGIGGGILLPIGPALAFDGFPQEERARASALIGVPLLLAPVFGPIAGGYLTDTFDWHSIFYINLPVGALALLAALAVLPPERPASTSGARFDWLGLALSTVGIVAVVYGLTLVTRTDPATVTAANPSGDLYGWGSWLVWTLIGGGGALLAIFAAYSLWVSRDPALDLRQLARRDFLVSNLFNWATALISFGLLLLLPVYFESVRSPGLSALDTGLALVPFGVGGIVGTLLAAALYRALGPRLVVAIGAVLAALSAWLIAHTIQPTATASQLLAAAQTHTSVAAVARADDLRWWLFLVGLSFTFMNIPVQTLALEALNGEALAKASSLFLTTKLIFSSIGVAILTTLLVSFTRSRATDLVHQLETLTGGGSAQPSSPQALAALHGLLTQIGVQAGTWAMQSIFWLIFYGSLGLVALALALPGRRRAASAQPAANADVAQTVRA
ncbi:MAG TPA: DHA2 family efflux MFS transporter permease subunit [Ktedonobacterales bacterium]|nr:DHA2 family efflux MFS transporter permease subunit [Ktedonobacterales bacterium]